jgi:hypothetical protein
MSSVKVDIEAAREAESQATLAATTTEGGGMPKLILSLDDGKPMQSPRLSEEEARDQLRQVHDAMSGDPAVVVSLAWCSVRAGLIRSAQVRDDPRMTAI